MITRVAFFLWGGRVGGRQICRIASFISSSYPAANHIMVRRTWRVTSLFPAELSTNDGFGRAALLTASDYARTAVHGSSISGT
jgi:hypothetical protein